MIFQQAKKTISQSHYLVITFTVYCCLSLPLIAFGNTINNNGFKVQGSVITDNKNESYVVLEDQNSKHQKLYKIGDKIGDIFVKKISRKKAELSDDLSFENNSTTNQFSEINFFNIDLTNVDISIFMEIVGNLTGRKYDLSAIREEKVSIISPREIGIEGMDIFLISVLEVYGYSILEIHSFPKIIPIEVKDIENQNNSNGHKLVDSQCVLASDYFVSIDLKNVDIHTFIEFISELTGTNFVFDQRYVKGEITAISPKIPLNIAYKFFKVKINKYGLKTVETGVITKIIPMSFDTD